MLDSKYVYTFISRFIEIMYIHPMNFEREIYIYNLSLYGMQTYWSKQNTVRATSWNTI